MLIMASNIWCIRACSKKMHSCMQQKMHSCMQQKMHSCMQQKNAFVHAAKNAFVHAAKNAFVHAAKNHSCMQQKYIRACSKCICTVHIRCSLSHWRPGVMFWPPSSRAIMLLPQSQDPSHLFTVRKTILIPCTKRQRSSPNHCPPFPTPLLSPSILPYNHCMVHVNHL